MQGARQGTGEEPGWCHSEISQTSETINFPQIAAIVGFHVGQYSIIYSGKTERISVFREVCTLKTLETLK